MSQNKSEEEKNYQNPETDTQEKKDQETTDNKDDDKKKDVRYRSYSVSKRMGTNNK